MTIDPSDPDTFEDDADMTELDVNTPEADADEVAAPAPRTPPQVQAGGHKVGPAMELEQ